MGIFDRFPYSSTHEMNLDFMLGKATEIAESLQEIDTHKDQAEQAAQAAQAAQTAAQAAQTAAQAAQTAAQTSAGQAEQHKTGAEDAADRAEAASNLADEAVEQAQTAATTAGTAAQNASAAETRINTLVNSLPSDFTELNNTVNALSTEIESNTYQLRNTEAATAYESVTGAVAWISGNLTLRNTGAYEGWTTKKYHVVPGNKYHVRGCYFVNNPIAVYVNNGAMQSIWNDPAYEAYQVKAYELDITVPENITELWISYYTGWNETGGYLWAFHKALQAKFAGKTWYCMGDSLTEFNITAYKKYYSIIQEKTGIIPIIDGVGGSGYINPANSNSAFFTRALNIPNTVDLITIFGSGNDISGYTLGSPDDTGTTTVCGCINTTIDNIYSVYPLAKLGIITPCPWQQFPTTTTNAMSNYVDALVTICRKRGIPCLDLFHCSGLRPQDNTFRSLAFYDGIHPNTIGYTFIAPHVENFIAQIIESM